MKHLKLSLAMLAMMGMVACGEAPAEEAVEEVTEVAAEPATPATVVDIAVGSPDHTTLVAAVTAAGLAETLSGAGPFTVFAPTNAAFAALPEGTVDGLLKPESKDALTGILTYHVVAGKVLSGDLTDGMKAVTVNGQEITIGVKDGKVTVNGANVVAADLVAGNGVVHVIDAVILPK
ncbi:MAG TPA: fasciclin domain-containing protein [Phnomibacter sp.]|nr:fasciclin domain-containing protein [Phnomibacter sp.]